MTHTGNQTHKQPPLRPLHPPKPLKGPPQRAHVAWPLRLSSDEGRVYDPRDSQLLVKGYKGLKSRQGDILGSRSFGAHIFMYVYIHIHTKTKV